MKKCPNKQCTLDPIPTSLLKSAIDVLAPTICLIVNSSLQSGYMPNLHKRAIVTPLIKKANSDNTDLKNYRPVSNLSFLSKLMEKAVSKQINKHISEYQLDEPLQSAYKPGHCTESALIKLQSDILSAMDEQHVVLLALLDLSAAFDTCNHSILLHRLEFDFHISDCALEWFRSYLAQREQMVKIGDAVSDPVPLETGFRQGSGLGTRFYNNYTRPLGDLLRLLKVLFHLFADDSQLYVKVNPSNQQEQQTATRHLEYSIGRVENWMTSNKLKLNQAKTEFVMFGTKPQIKKMTVKSINVGNEVIPVKQHVRNLGAHFDVELKMGSHVNEIVKAGYYHLRQLRAIRRYLTQNATKVLVHASILSRLDYGNALLYGIPEGHLNKLQKLQNSAARLITWQNSRDYITDTLKALHWLPVRSRIKFKILLWTHKTIHGQAPSYLRDLVAIRKAPRPTRACLGGTILVQPKSKLKSAGDRSFQTVAPRLWNALPRELRDCQSLNLFKKRLKTHLFKEYFC